MTRTRDEILEELDAAEEHYGDIYSQNASERALFGDSAIGSASVERNACAAVLRLRTELEACNAA